MARKPLYRVSPLTRAFSASCPVREHTGDGKSAGRCWHHVGTQGICPRHGDVRAAQKRYIDSGVLTNDFDLPSLSRAAESD